VAALTWVRVRVRVRVRVGVGVKVRGRLGVRVRVRVTHQAHDPHEARLHLRREVVRIGVRVRPT